MTWKQPRREPGTGSLRWVRGRGWRASYPHEVTGERVEWPVPRGSKAEKLEADHDIAAASLGDRLRYLSELFELTSRPQGCSLAAGKHLFFASLKQRELLSIKDDESRWRLHVERAPFYSWPIHRVGPGHVDDFIVGLAKVRATKNGKRQRNRLSDQTRKHVLTLLRRAFRHLIIKFNLPCANPAALIRVHVAEPDWTWLTIEEQRQLILCDAVPLEARLRYAFAMGCCLRRDEWQSLKRRDLDINGEQDSYMLVTRAAKNRGRKARRERVRLFGVALAAVKAWLPRIAPSAPCSPHGWLWPTPRGHKRDDRAFDVHEHYAAAGIRKHPYIASHPYHVLRHTGATALLNGLWTGRDEPLGRRWTATEVRQQLGHRTVKTTERYAHLTQPNGEPSRLVECVEAIASPMAKVVVLSERRRPREGVE